MILEESIFDTSIFPAKLFYLNVTNIFVKLKTTTRTVAVLQTSAHKKVLKSGPRYQAHAWFKSIMF